MDEHRLDSAQDIIGLMDSPSPADSALIEKAYAFAQKAHKDYRRLSGEPYLSHLVETAKSLAHLGMSANTVAAGLLHDSMEDAGVSPEQIEKEFGKDMLFLVDGVTKLGRLKYRGNERYVESLRKLLVATSKDARVLIIKLMDRLHNMQTLKYVPDEKRRRIALETLDIYAAIAHRLGIGVVRRQLEDLAFEYAYPEDYAQTKKLIAERESETRERLKDMTRKLHRALGEAGLRSVTIDYRVKGLYSFWRKLERKGGDLSKIHDLAALRVGVENISDCYRALGIVHELWQPLPGKIKDYIAFPKPNGYQSLHTTVFSGDGGIVEIQIRTSQMNDAAMYGIANHVSYKENGGGKRSSSFDWIKSLMPKFAHQKNAPQEEARPNKAPRRRYAAHETPEWLTRLGENENDPDFESALKTDIFSHRVFVFTPRGDMVDLPVSSTPIDFAYMIHSDIGDHCASAKINGKMAPLNTALNNGDIVEIETRKNTHPSAKWLDFTRTTFARRHIRNVLEKERKN